MESFRPSGLLTLASDFGPAGPYVGALRAAARAAAPSVALEDLWHGLPAQDIPCAAFLLPRLWELCPRGSVHLAVVDPGVGGARAALVVRDRDALLVGPDNGLFTAALSGGAEARLLDPQRHGRPVLCPTFHGRDLFAPAAARLASGRLRFEELRALGRPPVLCPLPGAEPAGRDRFLGRVVWQDPFGNLVTSLEGRLLGGAAWALELAGRVLPGRRTYSEAEPGGLLGLVGSFDLVEAACRDGSAAAALGPSAAPGAVCTLLLAGAAGS